MSLLEIVCEKFDRSHHHYWSFRRRVDRWLSDPKAWPKPQIRRTKNAIWTDESS